MRLLKLVPDNTNVDFVRLRYMAFTMDGLLLLLTVATLWFQGLNLAIDLTGGVLVEVTPQQTTHIAHLRQRVDALGFGEAQLQYFTGGDCDNPANSCVLIRV